MVFVKRRNKKSTPKPGHYKCPCGYVFFFTRSVDKIIENGEGFTYCPRCHLKMVVEDWVRVLRNEKIKKLKQNGARTRRKLDRNR